jgi:hypothetical protein
MFWTRTIALEAQTDIWMRLKKGQVRQWITYDAYYEAADIAGEEGVG